MNKGRPKLPDDERMQHVSIRLPKWMIDACKEEGGVSRTIRRALTAMFNYND